MGFIKNRRGSCAILTGAFAVPAAMSLAQQGVVSATPGGYVDQTAAQSLLGKVWQSKLGKAGVFTVGVLVLIAAFVLFEKSKGENKVEGFDENNGGVEGKAVKKKSNSENNNIIPDKKDSKLYDLRINTTKEELISKADSSGITPEEREFSNFIKTTKSGKVRFLVKKLSPRSGENGGWGWDYCLFVFDLEQSKSFLEQSEFLFKARKNHKDRAFVEMFDVYGSKFHTQVLGWKLCGYVDDKDKVHVFYEGDMQAIRSDFMSKKIKGGGEISEFLSSLSLIFD